MLILSRQQVIAVLLDNWKATGGVDEYVAWTNNPKTTHSDFYTDPQMKDWCNYQQLSSPICITAMQSNSAA